MQAQPNPDPGAIENQKVWVANCERFVRQAEEQVRGCKDAVEGWGEG